MAVADVNDEWSLLDDLVTLHSAENADELHRRLLCFGDGGGNKDDAFEPWWLLHRFHADEPDGAAVTALLLLTDRRWRHATSRLVRRIDESGLVLDDQLDLLAQAFLGAGPQVYWEAAGDWFDGPAIVLDPESHEAVERAGRTASSAKPPRRCGTRPRPPKAPFLGGPVHGAQQRWRSRRRSEQPAPLHGRFRAEAQGEGRRGRGTACRSMRTFSATTLWHGRGIVVACRDSV